MTDIVPTPKVKAYLLYISLIEFPGNVDQLNEFIAQNKNVLSWWNYIPSIYVITSSTDIKDLKDGLKRFIGDSTDLFLVEINSVTACGLLNPGAWAAFSKDVREVVKNQGISI